MEINGKEVDINSLVTDVEKDFLKNYNGILLNQKHIDILTRYGIDYKKYTDVHDLIFEIEDYLNDSYEELDDLEWVEEDLAERNYYQNTNK